MPDARISELPIASNLANADLQPLVQSAGGSTFATRRATLSQLRGALLADRGAHVRDYGARGDGTTNDAPAIQAAVNDLQSRGGGALLFGPRAYRIASAVAVGATMVRLQGAGFTEGPGAGQGTWLTVDGTGFVPFTFTGVAARGSAVCDIAVQQAHPAPSGPGWAPTAYPHVFRVEDCLGGVDFDNVFLARVHRGIYCRNSGRLDVRRLRGQVFTTAVEVDEAYDVPRLHNLHLWTFWSADENVVRWSQANGDALVFRRCDGVFVDQAFVLGYRSMFRFGASAAGRTSKFYIGQAYADFVRHGVWIEADGTDGQISGLTTQGEVFGAGGAPIAGASGIQVDASHTRVQVANLRVDDAEDNAIRVNGAGNRLDVFSLRCVFYNTRNNGAAAIHLADSGAAAANAVHVGAPTLLEGGNGGPLVNAGTNGVLSQQALAGRAARPGLAVGAADTGLFAPAGAGALAGAAGGAEVLRATGAGTVTLGGAPGGHALEVQAPPGTANRLVVAGGPAGAPVAAQAQGADANIGLVVAPKGSGALMAQAPEGTAAGGNARGASAVDWQQARASAVNVASGPQATIGGGQNNTASGVNAVVAGGAGNGALGAHAAVLGGQTNTADASWSWVPGGLRAGARGVLGRGAWASGPFAATGDAQAGEFVLRRQTGDATPGRLTADGAAPGGANSVNLPANATYLVRLMVVARQVAGAAGTPGESAGWTVEALVRRGASPAATAVVGGGSGALAPAFADAGAAAWRLAIAADTANGGIAVSGAGEANKTVYWVARVLSVEVAS